MSYVLDLIFVLFIGGAAYQGYKDGFVRSLTALLSTMLALYGAYLFYIPAAHWLSDVSGWRLAFCRILVYIVLAILINRLIVYIFYLLDHVLVTITSLPIIRTINRSFGAFFRGLEAVFLLGLVQYLVLHWSEGFLATWFSSSIVASFVAKVVGYMAPFLFRIVKSF